MGAGNVAEGAGRGAKRWEGGGKRAEGLGSDEKWANREQKSCKVVGEGWEGKARQGNGTEGVGRFMKDWDGKEAERLGSEGKLSGRERGAEKWWEGGGYERKGCKVRGGSGKGTEGLRSTCK